MVGALAGVVGGALAWGSSALGGVVAGVEGQTLATSLFGVASVITMIGHGFSGVLDGNGNWEVLAGAAAGVAGGIVGTYLGNRMMMAGVYNNINNSARIRQGHRQIQNALRKRGNVNFDNITYRVSDKNDGNYATLDPRNGYLDINKRNVGNSLSSIKETASA